MKNNIIPFKVTGGAAKKESKIDASEPKAIGDETYTRMLDDVLRKVDRSSRFEHTLYYSSVAVGFLLVFALFSIAMWRVMN